MLDRRESARDEDFYRRVAETSEHGTIPDSVVRTVSEGGASLQFSGTAKTPKKHMSLGIARKCRSFLARIIWWRDYFLGVAFSSEQPFQLPFSDLEQRLRQSEKKKRQLQRRINQLLREG